VTFAHDAIDRHLVAGAHPQVLADDDVLKGDFLLAPVGADHARRLGGEVEQGADRRTGALTRARLHHLPEQNQDADDRAGFEVNAHMPLLVVKAIREQPRKEDRDDAEEICRANTQADQREHVEAGLTTDLTPRRERVSSTSSPRLWK
jgi:hypothetical protein